MDQEQADDACPLTRWQHFSAWNDVMAAILKVWRQTENPTPTVDAYLLEEQSCQILTPVWFETTEPWAFFPDSCQSKKTIQHGGCVV